MRTEDRWSVIFDTLRDKSRRRVLVALLEADPRTVDDIIDEAEWLNGRDERARHIAFTHIHLPKLHDVGFIDWRKGANEVHRGPRFEEIQPVVELLQTNRDQLPDGWT